VVIKGRRPKRFRSNGHRRGLTVFIVLLVIGMLFAVGTFAAKMTTTGVSNAGRYKQMQQTHYLSEMGIQATLSELQRDPNGYKILLRDAPAAPPPGQYPCKETPLGLAVPAASPQCVRVGYGVFQKVARDATGQGGFELLQERSGKINELPERPGALGLGNVMGNFGSELTDFSVDDAPPGFPQEQASHMAFYRVTILSTGQVLPADPITGVPLPMGSGQFNYTVSQEETRAQVVFGPVPK
jgi:hypothetical protein